MLYGLAATLFAYCVSLFTASPLAAFAAVAGYQVIMFVVSGADAHILLRDPALIRIKLYEAGYLLTETYAKTSAAGRIITIIRLYSYTLRPSKIQLIFTFGLTDFTISILSPVASPVSSDA